MISLIYDMLITLLITISLANEKLMKYGVYDQKCKMRVHGENGREQYHVEVYFHLKSTHEHNWIGV